MSSRLPFRPSLRILAIAVSLGLSLPSPLAFSATPSAKDTVAAFLEDTYVDDETAALRAQFDDVEHRLYAWAKAGATRAELDRRLADSEAMPLDVARSLVELTFLRVQAQGFEDDKPDPAKVVERYLALHRTHPRWPVLLDEAALAIDDLQQCDGAAFDGLIAQADGPTETVRRRLYRKTGCLQVLMPLLETAPDDAAILHELADAAKDYGDDSLRLALLRLTDARIAEIAPDRRAALRADRLRAELRDGDPALAIAAIPAEADPLAAGVRDALDADDRRALSAALWLADRRAEAQRWRDLAEALPFPRVDAGIDAATAVAADKAPSADSTTGAMSAEEAVSAAIDAAEAAANAAAEIDAEAKLAAQSRSDERRARAEAERDRRAAAAEVARRDGLRRLLDHALHPDDADPFALLIQQHLGTFRASDDPYWPNVWSPLNDALAARDGYPGLVFGLAMSRGVSDYTIDEAVRHCHRCPGGVIAAIRATGKVEAVARVTRSGAANTDLPAEILARMDRQIDVQPAWPEASLPESLRTPRKARPGDDDGMARMFDVDGDRSPPPAWAKRLPAGEYVRHAVDGRRVVAITASQTLDPVGEVSSGGYWVSVSEDGGDTFAPPLYTGLRVFAPYVIRPTSKLPLIDGDVLRIEVALRRIDPDRIVFPPIALPIAESRDDLQLTIPLAELRRDADGDGLTDLVERAMLLDPQLADTDADGLNDAIDSLPQVPMRAGSDARSEALAVALDRILGRSLGAIVTTAAHAGGEPADGYAIGAGTDARHDAGTTFLVAPAAYFSGLALRERVVVLTPAQAERIGRARGGFHPIGISLFEVSRTGDLGVLVWSAGWTGGTLILRRVNGVWQAEATSEWIT